MKSLARVIRFNKEPVSYTHLDVYKRQHVSTAEGFCQMNDGEYYVSAENLAEDVQVGDIAVSYTHLAVYKRQD